MHFQMFILLVTGIVAWQNLEDPDYSGAWRRIPAFSYLLNGKFIWLLWNSVCKHKRYVSWEVVHRMAAELLKHPQVGQGVR